MCDDETTAALKLLVKNVDEVDGRIKRGVVDQMMQGIKEAKCDSSRLMEVNGGSWSPVEQRYEQGDLDTWQARVEQVRFNSPEWDKLVEELFIETERVLGSRKVAAATPKRSAKPGENDTTSDEDLVKKKKGRDEKVSKQSIAKGGGGWKTKKRAKEKAMKKEKMGGKQVAERQEKSEKSKKSVDDNSAGGQAGLNQESGSSQEDNKQGSEGGKEGWKARKRAKDRTSKKICADEKGNDEGQRSCDEIHVDVVNGFTPQDMKEAKGESRLISFKCDGVTLDVHYMEGDTVQELKIRTERQHSIPRDCSRLEIRNEKGSMTMSDDVLVSDYLMEDVQRADEEIFLTTRMCGAGDVEGTASSSTSPTTTSGVGAGRMRWLNGVEASDAKCEMLARFAKRNGLAPFPGTGVMPSPPTCPPGVCKKCGLPGNGALKCELIPGPSVQSVSSSHGLLISLKCEGDVISVQYGNDDTVRDLKVKTEQQHGIPCDSIRLEYKGMRGSLTMSDEVEIADYLIDGIQLFGEDIWLTKRYCGLDDSKDLSSSGASNWKGVVWSTA